MKNLILCLTLSTFAFGSSVLADNTQPSTATAVKKTDSCCDSKDCCSNEKKVAKTSKSACSKGMPSRHVFMSPKALANAGKS